MNDSNKNESTTQATRPAAPPGVVGGSSSSPTPTSSAVSGPEESKSGGDALLADAKGVASHLAADAKDAVGKLAGDAKSEIEKRLTSGKDEAAKQVGGVAAVLRHGVDELDAEGPLPRLADEAAQRIERVAEYVQSRTIGDLAREVERFARREPALFLGGSFALGLLGGRFLKSSASRRPERLAAEGDERGGWADMEPHGTNAARVGWMDGRGATGTSSHARADEADRSHRGGKRAAGAARSPVPAAGSSGETSGRGKNGLANGAEPRTPSRA